MSRSASWQRPIVPAALWLVISGCFGYPASSYGATPPPALSAGNPVPAAPGHGGQQLAGGSYSSTYRGGSAGSRSGYEVHRSSRFRQDFRDGDAEQQRRARDRLGDVPLEQRTRENRLERQDEATESRIDDAARRRAISPGGPSEGLVPPARGGVRENDEGAAGRRLERSTEAERQRQKEAAEIRRQLLKREPE